jgi:hypothetical protein
MVHARRFSHWLSWRPVMDRCSLVSGNASASVPAGHDAYIMKHIIHDWPDALYLKILKALPPPPGGN